MQLIFLGLGSNRPYDGMDSLILLENACLELSKITKNAEFSSVYRTKAMYVEDQNDFYNMACTAFVEDSENPYDFLKKINAIEAKYGRNREEEIRFGPRSLDIDIEYFGNWNENTEILQIPHPRITERAFVLIPLLEIFPESADKTIKERYIQCLNDLHQKGETDGVEKLGKLDQLDIEKKSSFSGG